jgi:hypothetical protein
MVGEEPSNVRMRVPPPTTDFDGLLVTLIENQRKAVVEGPRQNIPSPRHE